MDVDEALEVTSPGTEIVGKNAEQILQKVRELCGWRQPTFPGSQPVSLTRTNLRELNRLSYVACEKTDGVRYLLYAASKAVFLIDRLQTVQGVKFSLPERFNLDEKQQNTLLDGELVTDLVIAKDSDGNEVKEKVCRYLIYDAICICGQSVADANLLERLRRVFVGVIQPRLAWEEKNPNLVREEKETNNYLQLYLKKGLECGDFFEIWDIAAIANFSKRLPHLSDGIIFTPISIPYIPGTCQQLLKWKPPHLNSVDFMAEIIPESRCILEKMKPNSRKPVAVRLYVNSRVGLSNQLLMQGWRTFAGHWLALEGHKCKELLDRYENMDESVTNRIWECFYSFETKTLKPKITSKDKNEVEFFDLSNGEIVEGGWCVERIRTDKSTPNDERVVQRVFESICDGIDFPELIATFHQYKQDGKKTVSESCDLPTYYNEHGCARTRADKLTDEVESEKKTQMS